MATFEAAFGGPNLFDRFPEGLRLNAAGEQLVLAAESVEHAVLRLERRRAVASPVLSGNVRVSTGECAAGFLARSLSGSTTTALPAGITLELVESRQTANLARREADMALRHQPPESGEFYVSKAGTFACAVYRRRGANADVWVTYTDEQAHYAPARWVQRQVEETGKPVVLRASSMLMHLEAIRAGTGRGVLPCYVGDGHPLLERLTPPISEIAAEYWIIVHRDLRRAACVRAVIDWVKGRCLPSSGTCLPVPLKCPINLRPIPDSIDGSTRAPRLAISAAARPPRITTQSPRPRSLATSRDVVMAADRERWKSIGNSLFHRKATRTGAFCTFKATHRSASGGTEDRRTSTKDRGTSTASEAGSTSRMGNPPPMDENP